MKNHSSNYLLGEAQAKSQIQEEGFGKYLQ